MKVLIATSLLFVAPIGLAHADQPGANWIGASTVTEHLQAAGYNDVRDIEADDGYWKAKAIRNGQLFKLKLDPESGKIISAKPKVEDED